MSSLSNAFSVLNLDAEDDTVEIQSASDAIAEGKLKENGKKSDRGKRNKDNISSNGVSEIISGEYKQPLVWIDLEMTGLDVENDRILEIACIVTDGKLTKSVEGPDLVVRQPKECLDNMGDWCKKHHSASGLTEKVIHSTVSVKDAEKQEVKVNFKTFEGYLKKRPERNSIDTQVDDTMVKVIEFIRKHIGSDTPLLAGNSVYMDLLFLKKYMPTLAAIFPHVLVDVSSIVALCVRWFPRERKQAPLKEKNHRAMDDIRESIKELKYYKSKIFKTQGSS